MEIENVLISKSFREVHAELEMESLLLERNHNVADFKNKADFLKSIGFSNSIATKLYAAISENADIVKGYAIKYPSSKFILEPQLERICEKYNLFVRPLDMFLGDIPEKNIKDIMKFKIHISDIDWDFVFKGNYFDPNGNTPRYSISDVFREFYGEVVNLVRQRGINELESFFGKTATERMLNAFNFTSTSIRDLQVFEDFLKRFAEQNNTNVSLQTLCSFKLGFGLDIAAVKPLFNDRAFSTSLARIINKEELIAKHQVDLDPIVLMRTKHGRLIVTAWGDEANDELVLNQTNN